ncbi:universal stress protein [Arcticibacter eurypsychrophilus]|uniref:universal stress protein n=1 Tax=Arcticibacter eurypsychrophilus TaxID=1434752 RepID=UPI00084D0E10|nr:universal stress protein [Arcticibacter eurypsychrophilus]
MKKILVPTDFSKCADKALDFAVRSVRNHPIEIILLHVFEEATSVYTDYVGVNKEYNLSLLVDARKKLNQLKSSIEDIDGVIVSTCVKSGNANECILLTSKEKEVDMIIMGTFGSSDMNNKLFGSKTASIIGKSKVPVLAIPFDYQWKKPSKILLATNHFEKDPLLLNFIFKVADLYEAKVQVAVVSDEEEDEASTILERTYAIPTYETLLKEKYKEQVLAVKHLYGTEFEETLEDYIQEQSIDMLSMVTYQRSFLDRVFQPSMSKRMANHTKIPLLVIPSKHESLM